MRALRNRGPGPRRPSQGGSVSDRSGRVVKSRQKPGRSDGAVLDELSRWPLLMTHPSWCPALLSVQPPRHAEGKIKMLYTVAVHHNPTGITMSDAKRKRLVELAREHKFIIVADEAYQLLNFEPSEVKPMFYYDDPADPRVLSVGAFSKLIGPGVKVCDADLEVADEGRETLDNPKVGPPLHARRRWRPRPAVSQGQLRGRLPWKVSSNKIQRNVYILVPHCDVSWCQVGSSAGSAGGGRASVAPCGSTPAQSPERAHVRRRNP